MSNAVAVDKIISVDAGSSITYTKVVFGIPDITNE
jgi:hypothetical protein